MLPIYRKLVKPAFCAPVFSFFILTRQRTRIITEAVTITAPPTPAPTPMPKAVPRETFGLIVQYNHIKGAFVCVYMVCMCKCSIWSNPWNMPIKMWLVLTMYGNIIDDTHKDHFVQMLGSAVWQELVSIWIILWSTAGYSCTKNSFSISNKILYIGTYYSILIYHGMKMAKYMLTATSFLNGHLLHYTLFWKLYIVILRWKWDIMTRNCPHHLTWKHWINEWTCMARSRVNSPTPQLWINIT